MVETSASVGLSVLVRGCRYTSSDDGTVLSTYTYNLPVHAVYTVFFFFLCECKYLDEVCYDNAVLMSKNS